MGLIKAQVQTSATEPCTYFFGIEVVGVQDRVRSQDFCGLSTSMAHPQIEQVSCTSGENAEHIAYGPPLTSLFRSFSALSLCRESCAQMEEKRRSLDD
jgi:hypothetical protein